MNYYGRQIKVLSAISELKDRIVSEIADNAFSAGKTVSDEIVTMIVTYIASLHSQIEDVHIGKASRGWAFTFNHNDWKYFTDKQSLYERLKTVEIYDEYNRHISYEDFINEIESKFDGEYATRYKVENPESHLLKDGLTFSTSTNFS